MREIRGGVFQGRFHNLLISKNNTFWAPQISRITFQVVTGPQEWLVVTRHPRADAETLEARASQDAPDQDARYRYQYYLTPTQAHASEMEAPSLAELARVIQASVCIEASCRRGKGEAGMDEYQVRTWEGWHHHMTLTLIAVVVLDR